MLNKSIDTIVEDFESNSDSSQEQSEFDSDESKHEVNQNSA